MVTVGAAEVYGAELEIAGSTDDARRASVMRRIVAPSLRFRWLVAVRGRRPCWPSGFVRIPNTKVDVFPEFAPPRVEIQTIALGNSSNEVEELITVPIENQLNGIEGLEDDALQVGRPAVLDPADLRAGDRRAAGPPAGRRADRPDHADAADLGQPAVHDAGRCRRPAGS